jgi:hypothetical protein
MAQGNPLKVVKKRGMGEEKKRTIERINLIKAQHMQM